MDKWEEDVEAEMNARVNGLGKDISNSNEATQHAFDLHTNMTHAL